MSIKVEFIEFVKELKLFHPFDLIDMDTSSFTEIQNQEIESSYEKVILEDFIDITNNKITGLYLTNTKMNEIPDSISKFTDLEILDLRSNRINQISPQISALKNLKTLILRDNKITELPESIAELKNLEELILCTNKLVRLPRSLSQLNNLRILNVAENHLVKLDEELSKLTKLENFDFTFNELEEIPEIFTGLTKLTSIDFTENRIKFIPDSIHNIVTHLKSNSARIKFRNNEHMNDTAAVNNFIRYEPKDIDEVVRYPVTNQLILKTNDFILFNQLSDNFENLLEFDLSLFSWKNKSKYYFYEQYNQIFPSLKIRNLEDNNPIDKLVIIDLKTYNSLTNDEKKELHTKYYQKKFYMDDQYFNPSQEIFNSYITIDNNILLVNDLIEDIDVLIQNKLFQQYINDYIEAIEVICPFPRNKLKHLLNEYMRSFEPNEKLLANKFYENIYLNKGNIIEKYIPNYIPNYVTFLYFIIGSLIVFGFKLTVGATDLYINGWLEQIILAIFFVFQVYQGFTIQEYAKNFIERLENFNNQISSLKIGSSITSKLFVFISKLRSSFGVLVILVWISALTSIDKTLGKLDLFDYSFGNEFLDDFVTVIGSIVLFLSSFNVKFLLPELPFLSFAFFSDFFSIFIRSLGILGVFWAVYEGGWKVIIFPTLVEERDFGDKLDWYEVLALPIGIAVLIIGLIIDNSRVASLPIILFQLGLLLGGVLHAVVNKRDRYQMFFTLIFIICLGLSLSLIESNTSDSFSSETKVIQIIILFSILIVLVIPADIARKFLFIPFFIPMLLESYKQKNKLIIDDEWFSIRIEGIEEIISSVHQKADLKEYKDAINLIWKAIFRIFSELLTYEHSKQNTIKDIFSHTQYGIDYDSALYDIFEESTIFDILPYIEKAKYSNLVIKETDYEYVYPKFVEFYKSILEFRDEIIKINIIRMKENTSDKRYNSRRRRRRKYRSINNWDYNDNYWHNLITLEVKSKYDRILENKPNILTLIGISRYENGPTKKIWNIISKNANINGNLSYNHDFGIFKYLRKSISLEKDSTEDLVTTITVLMLYVILPLLFFSYLSFLPIYITIIILVSCIIIWYLFDQYHPYEIKQLMKEMKISSIHNKLIKFEYSEGNLNSVVLTLNNANSIPKSIQLLKTVKELTINSESLDTIPEQVGLINKLEFLCINGVNITNIHSNIGKLENLKKIFIENTQIKNLPETIFQNNTLEEIHLANNLIETIPQELSDMQSLTLLDLHGNNITTLPDTIGELQKITMLDFSNNKLEDLPRSLTKLKTLKFFEITHNPLNQLSSELKIWLRKMENSLVTDLSFFKNFDISDG
ncbi:MAG: hypothetical protein OEZ01_00925 [Candidatus Heimdallarchaeota archaeon]|nr:hypothetical protein [Candidatus Heimdallarchaeota archaeon]MDH5644536.1 hypothetical protein [Candidatus Heimdallarchaeota archaeon]